MSRKPPISQGGSGESKVSQELKALRRVKAPWYMEADLQKRLRFQDRPGAKFMLRPLPAYALSGAALVVLLLVGYNMIYRMNPAADPVIVVPESPRENVGPLKSPPPTWTGPSSAQKEMQGPEPEQRGPSPPGEAAIQAKITDRRPDRKVTGTQDSTTRTQDSTRTDSTKMEEVARDSFDVVPTESDTTKGE